MNLDRAAIEAAPASYYAPERMMALDLETHLIEPGILAPRVVCGSSAAFGWADLGNDPTRIYGHLHDRETALSIFAGVLAGNHVLVGANIAFDLGCVAHERPDLLPAIFRAYAEGRVYDVLIAQALDAIAGGHLGIDPRTGGALKSPRTGKQTTRYSLEIVVDLVLGRTDAKDRDYWRTRYALLDGTPIAEWPEEARQYPIDDAVNTLEVAVAQVRGIAGTDDPLGFGPPHRNLGDLAAQVETAFALHLGALWGLRTDPDRVAELRARTEMAHASFAAKFAALGFLRADGSEDQAAVKRAVARAYGATQPCANPYCSGGQTLSAKTGKAIRCPDCSGTGLDASAAPRTAKGGVSCDRDSLVESGDPDLAAYGESEPEKVRETYLPWLDSGTDRPVVLRPNVLVASGRTSYDGLVQILPRAGGVRECFRARGAWSGSAVEYVYCSVDYAALELCTLAQVCLWTVGRSAMADVINASGDPGALHTAFAAAMVGATPEDMAARLKSEDLVTRTAAKAARQAAKAANFGFPGGMGAAKLVLAKRKRSEGSTTAPDGTVYPGVRFCVLLAGAETCGAEKITEWRERPIPPTCAACVRIVEDMLRPAWFRQWPEVREYHAWVSGRVEFGPVGGAPGDMPCHGTTRIRGGCSFTDGANHGFQALAADGAKYALRCVTRECYLGTNGQEQASPLAGSRPVLFLHDEIVAEVPDYLAHLAGPRMASLMVAAMREYVPDVAIKAEPALMRRWYKDAEPRYADGRLAPWEPEEATT